MKYLVSFLLMFAYLSTLTCQTYPSLPLQKEHDKTIIPICSSLPLVGENSIIGRQLLASIENYLREYKHFTTVATQDHKLIIKLAKNNKDVGNRGLEAIKGMLPLSPLFVGIMGTETILSLAQQLNEQKLLLLFPLNGDVSVRKLGLQNVIFFRPTHEKELHALAQHAIKTKHKTSVAIFYESSVWGKNLLEQLKKILAALDITPIATASYAQGTVEVEKALKSIAKAAPNAVFCLAHPRPAYTFISNALNVGLHECLFLGLSQLAVIQKLLNTARGLDIAVTSVVPNVQESRLPIVLDYKKAMQSFLSFRDDSPFYFEAFITMALFEDCLKKIHSPFTLPAIINSFESIKDVNFKGIKLSFDSTDRSLSSALWINPGIDQEWIEY